MNRSTWIFLSILGFAIILRLILSLSWHGYWGVDGGASLLNVNYVLGNEPTGAGFPKPPLAPGFTLAPFVLTMGADIGYKVWSALFGVLPIIPLFLLTRRYVGEWPAVIAALFASVDWFWGEMFVTGAHPLTAFALIGMAWYSIAAKADEQNYKQWTRHDIIIPLSVGLIPWVNQTAAGLGMIVLPIYFLALCWYKRALLLRVAVPCVLGGIMAISALPWYMQTLPGSDILTYDGPIIYWAWGTNTIQALFIALPLGITVIWKAKDYRVRALGVMLLTMAALVPWLSYDEVLINPPYRARYLMALAFYPAMAWVVVNLWLPKIPAWLANKNDLPVSGSPGRPFLAKREWAYISVAILAAFVYMFAAFIYVVRTQAATSAMVTPETAIALEGLRNGTLKGVGAKAGGDRAMAKTQGEGIATNSFTLSLWVAGLNRVRSPFLTTAPPPPYYRSSDQLLRCAFGWVPDCDGRNAASTLGIRYILVEERFPHYNKFAPGNYLAPDNQWEVTANAKWLKLVYSAGTTRLYEVN